MGHQIIIGLEEYNSLIKTREDFKTAFDKGKTVVFHDSYFPGHSGYPVHQFTVVNNEAFTADLLDKIKQLEKEKKQLQDELGEENNNLKIKLNKISWLTHSFLFRKLFGRL